MIRIFLLLLITYSSFTILIAQNFVIPNNFNHSGGTYSIYRSDNDNTITVNNIQKPFIWVEGFEVSDELGIQENYDLIDINSTLEEQIHAAGYDIVILNFNNPNDYIQRNAKVLQELIQTINNNKPHNEPLVIMGYSMGGLVARYALVEMENNNIDHETSLYISYDAPHKGAHVPVAVQALALTFGSSFYQQQFPELQEVLNRFNSPAAKQMLKYRLSSGTTSNQILSPGAEHVAFMNELNSLNSNGGFPQQCQSVGLSLGSWSGIPQRANFDGDHDGQNDFQHAAFPAILINIPEGDLQGSQHVWDYNTCDFVSYFGFQSFLSTTNSFNYPYYNTRSSYLGLQDYGAATFWYSNQMGLPTFPSGSWSRLWAYADGEPLDFAPGSFTNSYSQITSSLNTQVDCSFAYYDNSSFVSTVSALAFNTTDLFYNIGDDQNRLSKTPFDDIFAFCGDNRSHTNGIASSNQLVNWVMSKVNNSGTVNSCYCLSNLAINGADIICTSEVYHIDNLPTGSNVVWTSTWNSAPYPTLTQNTPNANQCTITNLYMYPSTTTLSATVFNNCRSVQVSKIIASDYQNAIQYGTYFQESCYFHNKFNQANSGSLPTIPNTPLFLRQGCLTTISLQNMVNKTVSFVGATPPLYWNYNSQEGKLYVKLPYMSSGIPFTFKVSGLGACQEKNILLFSINQPYYPSFKISPNPTSSGYITISLDCLSEFLEEKNHSECIDLSYSINIIDALTGDRVLGELYFYGNQSQTINISKLRNGVYILKIRMVDYEEVIRFVKE